MPSIIKKAEPACAATRSDYIYRFGDHELRIHVPRVELYQIEAVREGLGEFALVVEDPVILLCARFGDAIPWTAAVYTGDDTPRTPNSVPFIPRVDYESRALLHVALIDAATGRTCVERILPSGSTSAGLSARRSATGPGWCSTRSSTRGR